MAVPTFPSVAEAKHEDGFLHSRDHLRLYWQRYRPPRPRATVAILHGGGDHSGRYPALTSALVQAENEVVLVDFRGHGQSDGRRWDVDAFSDYLMDLDAFMERVREGAEGRDIAVIGHSMGGLIAALWALEPGRGVCGLALSSPYLKLAVKLSALKYLGARIASRIVPFLSVSSGLRSQDLTSDPELQAWTERDPLYGRTTTVRWFQESSYAQHEVRRRAGALRYPLMVMIGTADTVADHQVASQFLQEVGSVDKTLRSYPGLRHELFNEVGRERPIADTVAWVSHCIGGETR